MLLAGVHALPVPSPNTSVARAPRENDRTGAGVVGDVVKVIAADRAGVKGVKLRGASGYAGVSARYIRHAIGGVPGSCRKNRGAEPAAAAQAPATQAPNSPAQSALEKQSTALAPSGPQ